MANSNFREFNGSTGQDNVLVGTENGDFAISAAGASSFRLRGENIDNVHSAYKWVVTSEDGVYGKFGIIGPGNIIPYIALGTEVVQIRGQIVSGDNNSDVNGISIVGGSGGSSPIWLIGSQVVIKNMPTVDPHVVGALWNSAGVVHVSAG